MSVLIPLVVTLVEDMVVWLRAAFTALKRNLKEGFNKNVTLGLLAEPRLTYYRVFLHNPYIWNSFIS